MKRHLALVLALTCVSGLVGCAQLEQEPITSQESVTHNESDVPAETIIVDNENHTDTTNFVVSICDRTKELNIGCNQAGEKIYEDENNEYFFNEIKSHYIVVTYNNGNSEDVVTALNAGRVAIADLDEFGIEYITEPKSE